MFVLSLGISATTLGSRSISDGSISKNNNNNKNLSSKNLLGLKINIFKFLNDLLYRLPQQQQHQQQKKVLFPSLLDSSITNLNNSKNQSKLPINCAADDLDLSLGGSNDQIEFFTNFMSNSGNVVLDSNSVSTANSAVSSLSNSGILMAPQSHNQNSYQNQFNTNGFNNANGQKTPYYYNTPGSGIPINHPSAKQNVPEFDDFFDVHQNQFNARNDQLLHHHQQQKQQQQQHNHSQSFQPQQQQSQNEIQQFEDFNNGYNLNNVLGLNQPTPYFNDFNHQVDIYLSSSAVSSNESYINPLDDEFFKKFNSTNNNASATNNTSNSELNAYNVTPFSSIDILVGDEDDEIEDFSRKRKFDSISSVSSSSYEYSLSQEQFIPPTSLPNTRKPSLLQNQSQIKQQSTSPKKYKKKKADLKKDSIKKVKKELIAQSKITQQQPIIQENKKSSRSNSMNNGEGLAHSCPHCDAAFKVKGYLTRHLKKHNSAKAFMCPFYQEPSDGTSGTKCHPTGGFSRRDTYKTHLKALHFIYPPGTKSNERNSISGRCAGCFQFFENNVQWLETHIETGSCKGTVEFKLQQQRPTQNTNDNTSNNIKVKSEIDFNEEELGIHANHYIKQEILD
ncbi:zinc finger protein [Scheffersomyces coipomensis]|uniref:zinc finger protein n=1 Tax=Scheffersomyces coipomensis TaxID=1788519 RepID=UPI00315D01CC